MVDDEGWEIAARYGISAHPAIVLVDADGGLVGGFYGEGDAAGWDELAAEL